MFVEGRLVRPALDDMNEARVQNILGIRIFETIRLFAACSNHLTHGGLRLAQTLGRNSYRTYNQEHDSAVLLS